MHPLAGMNDLTLFPVVGFVTRVHHVPHGPDQVGHYFARPIRS